MREIFVSNQKNMKIDKFMYLVESSVRYMTKNYLIYNSNSFKRFADIKQNIQKHDVCNKTRCSITRYVRQFKHIMYHL